MPGDLHIVLALREGGLASVGQISSEVAGRRSKAVPAINLSRISARNCRNNRTLFFLTRAMIPESRNNKFIVPPI